MNYRDIASCRYRRNEDGGTMENEKNIEKTTRQEPRSVLLIDGRGEGDAPMDSWEDLLDTAYSRIAPVDDGISHLDIDGFKDCFDIHEGVAFPTMDIYDSNNGTSVDVIVLVEPWRIDELPDDYSDAVWAYCVEHRIPTDTE